MERGLRTAATANGYVVGDLMTIDPIVVSPEAPLDEAERLLELYEVSGLPVVDASGRLVGVISQTDILHRGDDGRGTVRRRPAGVRVAELMSSPAITVQILTPLADAARLMRDAKVHRVVAVNAAGSAIGVLSSMDFVALCAEG